MAKKVTQPSCAGKPRFAVAVAEFHSTITESLLKACLDEFSRHGVCECEIEIVRVPGAFELPLTALKMGQRKNILAVICLGAVIRGETLHYELVAEACARGLMDVMLAIGKPVIFEVLAADTIKLCQDRALEGDTDNKGAAATRAALSMTQVLKTM